MKSSLRAKLLLIGIAICLFSVCLLIVVYITDSMAVKAANEELGDSAWTPLGKYVYVREFTTADGRTCLIARSHMSSVSIDCDDD